MQANMFCTYVMNEVRGSSKVYDGTYRYSVEKKIETDRVYGRREAPNQKTQETDNWIDDGPREIDLLLPFILILLPDHFQLKKERADNWKRKLE